MTSHLHGPLRNRRRLSLALLLALAVGAVACSGGTSSTSTSSTAHPSTTAPAKSTTTTTNPHPQLVLPLYFIRGTQLGVAHRVVNSASDPRYVAMQQLLGGPEPTEVLAGLGTAIPSGTVMRGLQIKNGVAVVNFSPQFAEPGPPASLSARLGQVVYTLTAYPNVKSVTIQVSKTQIVNFAGVNMTSPVGRSQVTAALPGVLLENPAVGDSVAGTLQLTGLTSITGTYDIQLVDASGRLLAALTNTAVVGATFSQTVPLAATTSKTATLRVFARPAAPTDPTQEYSLTLPIVP